MANYDDSEHERVMAAPIYIDPDVIKKEERENRKRRHDNHHSLKQVPLQRQPETAIALYDIRKGLKNEDLIKKFQEHVFKDVATKELKKIFIHHARNADKPHRLMPDPTWHAYLKDLLAETDKIEEGQGSMKQGDWYWVTINPPQDDLPMLKAAVEDFVSRRSNWQDSPIWAYEQRSEEQPWKGFHCHIMFNRKCGSQKIAPKVIEDTLWTIVKTYNLFPPKVPGTELNFRGSKAGKAAIHCRPIKMGTEPQVYRYLQGFKTDEYKEKPCLQNEQWRDHSDLQQIYGYEEAFEKVFNLEEEIVFSDEEKVDEEEELQGPKQVTFAKEGLEQETYSEGSEGSEEYSEEGEEACWNDADSR